MGRLKELRFTTATSPVLDPELDLAEKSLGFRLPFFFREFCRKYNGGYPADENCYYEVPALFRAFHSEYGEEEGGVHLDGFFGVTASPPQCDLRQELGEWDWSKVSPPLLPIAHDLLGNYVVMRCDQPEGFVFWRDHELWTKAGTPRLFPIAESLEDFYNGLQSSPWNEDYVRNFYQRRWANRGSNHRQRPVKNRKANYFHFRDMRPMPHALGRVKQSARRVTHIGFHPFAREHVGPFVGVRMRVRGNGVTGFELSQHHHTARGFVLVQHH
jgi:hypothetical protein